MEITQELIEKAKTAEDADALRAFAKENGIAMSQDEAKRCFANLHLNRALSDEELDNVSGGCGKTPYDPKKEVRNPWECCSNWTCICGSRQTDWQRNPNNPSDYTVNVQCCAKCRLLYSCHYCQYLYGYNEVWYCRLK